MKQGINPQEMACLLESVPVDIKHQLATLYNPIMHGERQALVVIRTLFYRLFPGLYALIEDQNDVLKLVTLFKDCQLFQSLHHQLTDENPFDSKILALIINGKITQLYEKLSQEQTETLNIVIAIFYNNKLTRVDTNTPSQLFSALCYFFHEHKIIEILSRFCNQHHAVENKNEIDLLCRIVEEMSPRLQGAFLKQLTPTASFIIKHLIHLIEYKQYSDKVNSLPKHEVMDDSLGWIDFHANFNELTSCTEQEIYQAIAVYYFPHLQKTHPERLKSNPRELFIDIFLKHRAVERVGEKLAEVIYYRPKVLSNQQILIGLSGKLTLIEQEEIEEDHKSYLYILAAANGHFRAISHLSLENLQIALEAACHIGTLSIVKKLIEWSEVNYKLSFKKDLEPYWIDKGLECAAKSGQLEVIKWLIEQYYLKFAWCTLGEAFHIAVAHQQHQVMHFLLNFYRQDITFNDMGHALVSAAKNGELEIVRLLNDQWKVQNPSLKKDKNTFMFQALETARKNRHIEVVGWLQDQTKESRSKTKKERTKKHQTRSTLSQWSNEGSPDQILGEQQRKLEMYLRSISEEGSPEVSRTHCKILGTLYLRFRHRKESVKKNDKLSNALARMNLNG